MTQRRPEQSTESQFLEELVAAAAAGDRKAQDTLLRQYWLVIHQAVRGRKNRIGAKLASREDTQDLQQVAALKVLTELPAHEWRGSSAFVAWVKKLSRHKVSDAYRHHSARKRDAGVETSADKVDARGLSRSAESRFDDHQKVEKLMAQVQQLKPEYGAALMMHHLGFTMAQIGEMLGCSAEAARKLVARARAKLVDLQSD
jgi:RNA polymerase sigma factor (sigma-70 family)